MNHANKGIAVIFNHKEYDKRLGQKPRTGTDFDRDELSKTLSLMGFLVQSQNEFTLDQMEAKLQDIAKMDHSNNDCIVVAIFTHGEGKWLYARDRQYKLEWLWEHLDNENCPSLSGKPKIFIVQVKN